MNKTIKKVTSINDLFFKNREERRRLFKKFHNKVFLGYSWAQINAKLEKMVPYINPNPKVFKEKKHHA